MQKHFPSLSFCVGIAFGEHRVEAMECGVVARGMVARGGGVGARWQCAVVCGARVLDICIRIL